MSKIVKTIPRPLTVVHAVYWFALFLALHAALPAYINSSFLSLVAPEKLVGIIYTVSSLLTIAVFAYIPKLLRTFGIFSVVFSLAAAEVLTMSYLAFAGASQSVLGVFVLSFIITAILGFTLDIFLEHNSKDKITGEIRGTFLFFANIAWIAAQVVVASVVTDSDYWKIYALAAIVMLPTILLSWRYLRSFKDPQYIDLPLRKAFATAWKDRDARTIYIANFLLQFFFTWMIIYTPIYLHNHIGFDWQSIAVMFSVMLIPFVLVEPPLGKIADRYLGEKELLIAGFLIMAVTTIAMTFLQIPHFLLWMLLLFVSRIGASMVEIMSETYFFKHVRDRDVSLIGLFRTTRPWAYVLSPLLATIVLPFVPFNYLFLILGIIMILGALQSHVLKDTR